MKILLYGDTTGEGFSSWQRLEAFRGIGHEVVAVNSHREDKAKPYLVRLLPLSLYEATLSHAAATQCELLMSEALRFRPDLIWLEWPLLIDGGVIRKLKRLLPAARIVSFQDDNPFGRRHRRTYGWQRFLEAIPEYHAHVVKRSSDLVNYRTKGANKIYLFEGGYSELLWFPPLGSAPLQDIDVSFVGTPLDHRVPFITSLIEDFKVPISIFGPRWLRGSVARRHPGQFHPGVEGAEYRKIIHRSKISLGFVSSSNLDEWTMRSYEIPACGGFFLGERTAAHRKLFEEGREAEFFETPEECAQKVANYLASPQQRLQVANNGLARSVRNGYGLKTRLDQLLSRLCQELWQ
jgi:spore maturation protein CgeB